MENTVQILLNHGDESPEALMQKLPMLPSEGGGGSADAPSMDADERLARQLAAEFERQPRISARAGGTTTATMQTNHRVNEYDPAFRAPVTEQQHQPISLQPASGTNKGRGLPTVLPSDFLRIPGTKYPVSSSPNAIISNARPGPTGASTMGQMMTDEQLARMLQDELFQEELRNNPEFSHLAGRRNRADHFAGGSSGQMTGRSTYGGAGGGGGGIGERNDFFDRLSGMYSIASYFSMNFVRHHDAKQLLFCFGPCQNLGIRPSVAWKTLPLAGENPMDPVIVLVVVLPVEPALSLYGTNDEGCFRTT